MLDRDQCLRLLAEDEIGRLAVIAGNTPAIFPVNYALDGDTIVFRTDPGNQAGVWPAGARASFEVDRFDYAGRAGWSVVATGRFEESANATTPPPSLGCAGSRSTRGPVVTRAIGCAWSPIVSPVAGSTMRR